MNELLQVLQNELQRQGGVMPFARFMELALYTPGLGYYERREHTPGRGGDFFTSVSVGPLFGELLAHQFARWLEEQPSEQRPMLVEAGAHDGRLAADVLNALRKHYPDLWARLDFRVLEPSDTRAAWQKETLDALATPWRRAASWDELPGPITGIVYSNELLDALPVHRLGWDAARQEWFEWGVKRGCGGFAWARMPLSAPELVPDLPQALLEALPDGFSMEIASAALQWWQAAATRLAAGGRLMTVDYGAAQSPPLDPRRPHGSLRAYWRHTLQEDLLARPGEQDLTADIPFAAVEEAGARAGLVTEICEKQGRYLTRLALSLEQKMEWTPPRRRQFMTLTHPQQMGERFCVLVQRRPASTEGSSA